jgi:hypothetical protein
LLENAQKKVKTPKRIFLGLLLAVSLLLLGTTFYLVVFAKDPQGGFSWGIVLGMIVPALFFTLLFLCGLLAIVLTIMRNRTFPGLGWLIEKTLLFLYPFVLQIGRLLHIAQEKIERSFIEVNNQMAMAWASRVQVKADELLLLFPHCLQYDQCPYKITRRVENCRRCGKCQMAEILGISAARKLHVEVVTGGTMARQAVHKHRPRVIIAVACERDLTSGMLDSFPLPVIGIVNERPYGPCFNTRLDLKALERAINFLLN